MVAITPYKTHLPQRLRRITKNQSEPLRRSPSYLNNQPFIQEIDSNALALGQLYSCFVVALFFTMISIFIHFNPSLFFRCIF
ncbi:hypothetical protein CPC08DRAFT_113468 [Agrocybe pediades]|nr:hypothetical protein CPC08DRAFT_113468 [Agrocybe pediades]